MSANRKLVPEGVEGRVPFKSHLADTIFPFMDDLRAGMDYGGTPDIHSLQMNSRFVRITDEGHKESHPHDISITKEAPNYSAHG